MQKPTEKITEVPQGSQLVLIITPERRWAAGRLPFLLTPLLKIFIPKEMSLNGWIDTMLSKRAFLFEGLPAAFPDKEQHLREMWVCL